MKLTLCQYAKNVAEVWGYTDPLDICAGCEEDGSDCPILPAQEITP